MPKITILKGLPASGKSTFAKEQLKKDPNTKRVNKDDIRAMLDNSRWSKANEQFVLRIRDIIIQEAIDNGQNIIVDDTNLAPKHIERIKEIAKMASFKTTVEINDSFLSIPMEECIERDLKRPNSVGEKVIRNMYNQFIKPQIEPVKQDESLPKAVVFDVDGTLAKMGDRSPYDWKRVGEDSLNQKVHNAYRAYKNMGYNIVILSGRDSVCRPETEQWLIDNGISYDYLDMREEGNQEKDSKIKLEMMKMVLEKYYVEVIYDDRLQVVKAWRDNGFTCFQVDEGDF